jgi:hypothetical protein
METGYPIFENARAEVNSRLHASRTDFGAGGDSLSRAPMAKDAMPRNSGGGLARGLDQLAVAQFFQPGLDGAFRKTGRFRQHPQTRGHRLPFSARGLPGETKVNEKSGWLAIVANDVAHQDIEHVIIARDGFTEARHTLPFDSYTDKRTALSPEQGRP